MLVNGEHASHLAIDDRGLLYGDGLFETLAVRSGRPVAWSRHMHRLRRGCERLGLPAPDSEVLEREAAAVVGEAQRAVLKIVVTRGRGGRGYRPPPSARATRVLSLHPWPEHPVRYRTEGIAATVCNTPLGANPRLAGIKHLNRLEQVMARGEWNDEYQEGLMLDERSGVIEGTMSNVFVVNGKRLSTPDLSRAGVAGILRERILEAAPALGLTCRSEELARAQVESAEALFFCNSVIGIWPVRDLCGVRYLVPRVIPELRRALERDE